MMFRFKPRGEWLESRECPAVTWDWNPQAGPNVLRGDVAQNWRKDGVQSMTEIPSTTNDNVNFGMANSECDLAMMQGTLGTITVANTFTNKIKLGVNTAFQGCNILGACTLDLNGNAVNFGNFGANAGAIGVADSTRVTITGGGGSIAVSNNEKLDLVNVTLTCSVSVNAGGKLNFGYIAYGNDATSMFKINGGVAESDSPNATFISNQNPQGTYLQPMRVLAGNLNFVTSTTVVSYIDSDGTVTVKGTQASPNAIVTITGRDTPQGEALRVRSTGVLNLAAGSTISGTVLVEGGMNLLDPPPGSTATGGAISQGDLKVFGESETTKAVLNLNNITLNVTMGNVFFSYAAVTTNVDYDNLNGVRMGSIRAGGNVTFNFTNTLTQSATGTPKAFSMQFLIAMGTLSGDFNQYVLSDGVNHEPNTLHNITLSHGP